VHSAMSLKSKAMPDQFELEEVACTSNAHLCGAEDEEQWIETRRSAVHRGDLRNLAVKSFNRSSLRVQVCCI
jgi:hypothetical protein